MTTRTKEQISSSPRREFDIHELVRPNIRRLTPYHCARDDYDSGVLLDANENSLGSPFENELQLHRYPDPRQEKLRRKIAEYRDLEMNQVFVGVGSDEAIDLLVRIFCRPGTDNIIITPPTYGMYKVAAAINDIQVREVLLTGEFSLESQKILDTADKNSRLLFLCSPNNPTANRMDERSINQLLENFPGLVVIDEAYIDFSSSPGFCNKLNEWPNLVIIQTFSKSFGLAGVRLGVAMASDAVISWMMKVKAPYNINKLTEDTALKVFDDLPAVRRHIEVILNERERLTNLLREVKAVEQVYPSETNFLLVRISDAFNIYRRLADEGVIVRYRGNEPHCENCLRITVGTPDENDLLMKKLSKILS